MDSPGEEVLISCRNPIPATDRIPFHGERIIITSLLTHLIVALQPVPAQTEIVPPRWSVKELVEFHEHHHPGLKAQDVWKLFYEASFGGGHILVDSAEAVSRLMNELSSRDSSSPGEPLLEPISLSDDVVRVNLRPFRALNLSPSLLVKTVFQSARETMPDTLMFSRLWNEFSSLVRYGFLRFPAEEVRIWGERLEAGVMEVVHHSTEYAVANRPSYRIVRRDVFEKTFGKISP